jgi:RNA polymerase sigma factor (sigma-70 family)
MTGGKMEGKGERELLNVFRKEIGQIPLLTREQEDLLVSQTMQGKPEAMKRLIEANLRFALKVVFYYWRPGHPLMDMVSGACLGLVRSAKSFDPDAGFRFTTYAFPAIRQGVIRAIIESESYQYIHESLDAPSFDHDGETLLDSLVSKGITPEEEVERHDIGQYLSILTEREQSVIRDRFWKEKSLELTGLSIGVNKERVRQIETKALFKLRCALREKDILIWQKTA